MSATATASTRVGAVIGDPVEHSLSPALHNAAFAAAGLDAVLVALRVAPPRVAEAVRGMAALGFLGASVTVPHKRAVIAACDRVAAPADRIGAVNCLAFDGDAIVGHNTDAGGYTDALAEAGVDAAGRRAVILGSGGAARAVAAGLEDAGAAIACVIARTPANAPWTEARPWTAETLAAALPACDLVVDCTSMGLSAEREAQVPAPVPVELLGDGAVVSTLVYHRETALLAAARARGLTAIDGAGMLVHQGARAFTLWTGETAPVAAMWDAMRAATDAG